jgi:undecaprenyl diphosphate synthase
MAEAQASLNKTGDDLVSEAVAAAPVAPHGGGPPRHVAIIMDGNSRWARLRRLPGSAGHRAGARNVRPVAEACADAGVEVLTLFAFSTENWQRPKREVALLMNLLRNVLDKDVSELNARGVRLRIIGERSRFELDLQQRMTRAEALTAGNTLMTLNIAANFGGRWDILRAARALAQAAAEGRLQPGEIDEAAFTAQVSLGDLPAPDLCIRTGGEARISNFLLWDFAYTELLFTDRYWPEYSALDLAEALEWYQGRQRRFGRRP